MKQLKKNIFVLERERERKMKEKCINLSLNEPTIKIISKPHYCKYRVADCVNVRGMRRRG